MWYPSFAGCVPAALNPTLLNFSPGMAGALSASGCQPLMRRLGVGASSRASFGVHNTVEDVDALVAGLAKVQEVFA